MREVYTYKMYGLRRAVIPRPGAWRDFLEEQDFAVSLARDL